MKELDSLFHTTDFESNAAKQSGVRYPLLQTDDPGRYTHANKVGVQSARRWFYCVTAIASRRYGSS